MNIPNQSATPLDAEPALYRGLGVTALTRLLAAAAAIWTIPSILTATLIADGIGVLMVILAILVVLSAATTLCAANVYRRIERQRPYNWVNRAFASHLPNSFAANLVRHNDLWLL